ncbi:MAG TPA: RHS repeat-associated core domain-containing protein, partial [Chloroflexota bacterium]|nr:RHS repeat-associated core domain-containing protein [Chloroflexota bacterium]
SVFNSANQLSSISDNRGASSLFAANYGRDSNGQLASDSSLPSLVRSDRYTSLNQLCYSGSTNGAECSSPPSGSQVYNYDAADNLTGNNGTRQSFNNADELCWTVAGTNTNGCSTPPAGATTYRYDTRGNRTLVIPPSGSPTTLGYDQANRLTSWGTGMTSRATYTYSADGLRMSKTVAGVKSTYLWDMSGSLPLLLADGASRYIYGPGGLVLEQIRNRPKISLVGTRSASGDGTSLQVSLPPGIRAYDQIFVASTQPSTTTVSSPSGFRQVSTVTSGGSSPLATTTVFRRQAVGGESSISLSYSSAAPEAVVVAVYRNIDPRQPVDVTATGSAAAAASVTAPSVTPNYANDRLLVFQGAVGNFSGSSWIAPVATNEQVQSNGTPNASAALADETLPSAASTGTETSSFGQAANLTTVAVAVPQPPTVLFLHADQLGSTRLLTDSAGLKRGTFTFDPYGNIAASSAGYVTPFLFAGQYRDNETGFYYLRARYYDSATAQMISRDPSIGLTHGAYEYAGNNPLSAGDPTGLCGLWGDDTCLGDAVGAVATGVSDVAGAIGSGVSDVAGAVGTGISVFAQWAYDNTSTVLDVASGFAILGLGCAVGIVDFGTTCLVAGYLALGWQAVGTGSDISHAINGDGSWGSVVLDAFGFYSGAEGIAAAPGTAKAAFWGGAVVCDQWVAQGADNYKYESRHHYIP